MAENKFNTYVTGYGMKIYIPIESGNLDQRQAYQNFINSLSAILVKYASELKPDQT